MPPVPYHILETELKPTIKKNEPVSQGDKSSYKTAKPETKVTVPKLEPKRDPVAPPVKQDSKPVDKEAVKNEIKNIPVSNKQNNTLSQDTIERERKKIAEQLNSMRDREATLDKKVKADISKPEADVLEVPQPMKKSSMPTIDFVSERSGETSTATETKRKNDTAISEKPIQQSDPIQNETKKVSEQTLENPKVSEQKEGDADTPATPAVSEKPSFGRSKQRKGPKPSSSKTSEPKNESVDEKTEKTDYSAEKMSFGRSKRKK